MFGNINISSSFPAFSSGTHVKGKTGVIVSVPLELNETFLCSEFSLQIFLFHYKTIVKCGSDSISDIDGYFVHCF